MGLKIMSVTNGKTPEEEYVSLKTDEALNIKGYAVVDRTFASTGLPSNEFRHIFVFPYFKVEEGDWIILYSCAGENRSAKNTAGTYNHYFFWGSDQCVWNNNGDDVASLIQYTLVNSVKVPKV